MATDVEVAWAAGLFEGEGSSGVTNHQPRVQLVSTDEDVVRRFARIVGRGNVRHYEQIDPRRKDTWQWSVQSQDDVLHVLDLLWPFFCERRKERAYEVIERASKMHDEDGHCRRGHDLSVEENVYRHRKTGKRYCAICRKSRNAVERARRRGCEPSPLGN